MSDPRTSGDAPSPRWHMECGSIMMMSVSLVFVLVALIGAVVKVLDQRDKREEATRYLQARISDALLREPGLIRIMPIVHIPRSRTIPAAIELTGCVATAEQRRMAWRIVGEEAVRTGRYFRIEDRIRSGPPEGAHAATHAA